MANTRRLEDDVLSYCGSISGETFSSRHSKTNNNNGKLRQRSIDVIAKRLRDDYSSYDQQTQPDSSSSSSPPEKRKFFNTIFHKVRFMVVMFGGFSFGMMLLSRYNITVAILKMVNQTALYIHEHPDRTMDDFLAEGYTTGGEFDWDNEIQHMIMSWYMIAYTLPQVPATKLGLMIGSRWAIFISLSLCAISTLLTPMMAYWGWEWVIALRLLNGIGASAILPMMLNLIENWMPYNEISLGLTCAQLLQAILTAANPLVIGYLSSIHWKYAFYVPGFVMLGFCLLWMLLITDRPDESWLISKQELNYITYGCSQQQPAITQSDAGKQKGSENLDETTKKSTVSDLKKIPSSRSSSSNQSNDQSTTGEKPTALDVLKVPSFYAYLFMWSFYCSSFSGFTFVLPTYLRQFLKIEVSQNGFYCFIIQSGTLFAVIWPHAFLRLLESKCKFSQTVARRITHCVICSMVAFTWFYVGAFHDIQLPLLFLNRCFHGSNDIVVTGTLMTNYASAGLSSLVFSMVNTVGNLSVVFSSTFIGWLLDQTGQSREGWSWIYIGLAMAQVIMFFTFTTMIRSGPIDFGAKKRSDKQHMDPEQGNEKVVVNHEELTTHIEVISDKKENPGQMLNNFDSFRGTQENDKVQV